MPLPLADFNKNPVIFVDILSPALADLYRAFDVRFVLTSNVSKGRPREEIVSWLTRTRLPLVAENLHEAFRTPWDSIAGLEDEVEAWHATAADRTPTAYLIVTSPERGASLGRFLRDYAVALSGPDFSEENYIQACRILHSQTTFKPFNPDWY